MSDNENFEREFRFDKQDAADFLRKIAESIEEGDQISLDGESWKVFQKFESMVPFRIYSDKQSIEFGFKLLNPDNNQKQE